MGSEMCIRDRYCRCHHHPYRRSPAVAQIVLDVVDVLVVGEVLVHRHLHHEVTHVAGEYLHCSKENPEK